jgi:outer membrane protein OmpA-like peptidoglycan-associated protein
MSVTWQTSERRNKSAPKLRTPPPIRSVRASEMSLGPGVPLYLQRLRIYPKLKTNAPPKAAEQQADQMADSVQTGSGRGPAGGWHSVSTTSLNQDSTPAHSKIREGLNETRGGGESLPEFTRRTMEEKFGANFAGVRVHADAHAHRMAEALGANAFTTGNDIYFNANRFAPESREGRRLLAHELTHVAQQGGAATGPIQCDLMMSLPTALGGFEIEMATRAAPRPGMQGHIRFLPDPTGPYSSEIGLVQVVNVTDVGGRTSASGAPVDWNRVGTGAESGRQELMTTGLDGAPPGWFVDSQTAAHARESSVGPNYIEQWGIAPPQNQFGWLRSPTDWQAASLYDYPWFSFDVDFEFETVAKATDTQAIYGSLEWGFGIRSGAVRGEYAHAFDSESATFNEALERFRGYYTHEPIVLYFDTDVDTPLAGEEAKIRDVLDYLSRYPDVRLQIDGYADERGNLAHNIDLSDRRAAHVESLCVALGIDPARIDAPIGWGETTDFSRGSPKAHAGTWRANRRVVISFERTASTPIVMP